MDPEMEELKKKTQEIVRRASQGLSGSRINLSDLKCDKTMYFQSPHTSYGKQQGPFKASEISARSTDLDHKSAPFRDMDFDEIMKTSISADVRSKYRESVGTGRLSTVPRTTEMSLRTSYGSKTNSGDFWDAAKVSMNSFGPQNMSVESEDFQPAEKMTEKFSYDRRQQQLEFSAMPVTPHTTNGSQWERASGQLDQSFGVYCQGFLPNIRDLYNKKSPEKRNNRVAMVDVTNNEDESMVSDSSRFRMSQIRKVLKTCDSHKAQTTLLRETANQEATVSSVSEKINSLKFDNIVELTEKEKNRTFVEKENSRLEVPVRDGESHLQVPDSSGRGAKRRASSASNETPKSTQDKCLRSRSPSKYYELKAVAATQLKPNLEGNFKVPLTSGSVVNLSSFNKTQSTDKSSSREYLSAMNTMTEKRSLPNYGLTRSDIVFTSPTPSARSKSRNSPNFSQEGQLKRTASQLTSVSEFLEDTLPLKIKRTSRKLSWESVKLRQEKTKTVTIQNGSTLKLPLRVKIIGAGFTVTPREDFRMIPQEARSFDVKFSPAVVGPSRGELVFELATNSKCSLSIPLFAFGGHTSLRLDGVFKGPIGPSFVSMGLVKNLNSFMKQRVRLTNYGTLPGFASLAFEKTKLSDFSLSNSLQTIPSEVRLQPGESADIMIGFKATKDEIRKIISLNKEVTIVGEICVISGDEPTRLRLLKNKDCLPERFLKHLPKKFDYEGEFKQDLALFHENFDRGNIESILGHIKIYEVALTVERNLDETQIIAAELSMTEENTSFMTFCRPTNVSDNESDDETLHGNHEYFECSEFRISPAQIFFNRRTDDINSPKIINVESTSVEHFYVEVISSRRDVITANRSCGRVNPGQNVQVEVRATPRAFRDPYVGTVHVTLMVGKGKIEIPVKFVE